MWRHMNAKTTSMCKCLYLHPFISFRKLHRGQQITKGTKLYSFLINSLCVDSKPTHKLPVVYLSHLPSIFLN